MYGRSRGCAAHRFVLAGIFEPLAQKSRVDLSAILVQGEHVAENRAVGDIVEIFRPNQEGDFVAGLGQEEQAADNGPLGLNAARRLGGQATFGRCS